MLEILKQRSLIFKLQHVLYMLLTERLSRRNILESKLMILRYL